MKTKPLISIIVPVYNVEEYIGKCLSSCKHQTLENIEVIVVDDGSTDKSSTFCKDICSSDNRFSYYYQENDGAPGKARNRGIENSKGEYLVFLDSDDYLDDKACEKLYEAISSSQCDIVVGLKKFFQNGKEWFRSDDKEILNYLQKNNVLSVDDFKKPDIYNFISYNAQAKIFRKDLILKHKLRYPEKVASQDHVFTAMYLSCCSRIMFINDVVYFRILRDDENNKSLTQLNHKPEVVLGRMKAFKMAMDYFYGIGNIERALHFYGKILYHFNANVVEENKRLQIFSSFFENLDADLRSSKKSFLYYLKQKDEIESQRIEIERLRNNKWIAFSGMNSIQKSLFLLKLMYEKILFELKKNFISSFFVE